MLSSKQAVPDLGGDLRVDEGWWAAVMAEENSGHPTRSEKIQVNNVDAPVVSELQELDWDRVQAIYQQDEVVNLEVYGYNRGGLLVQGDYIQGFVPVSHLVDIPGNIGDEERRQMLAQYVGQNLELKVIECEPAQERIVLSQRAAQAGEGRRKQLFKQLHPGTVVVGKVTNVTDFGVFVELGGVEGLIHVSELSWGRVQNPKDIVEVDQMLQAMVLQVSEETARVALSLKRLSSNPWELLMDRYKPGDVIPARITTLMRFGAFARLDEGVEGLIHISSITFPPQCHSLEQFLSSDQTVWVRILHIDPARRRLGLALVNSE
jgi:small subunit ribosomal protein S1